MDEAPAKGVNVNFSYSGEYEQTEATAGKVQEYLSGMSSLWSPPVDNFDHSVEFWGKLDGDEIAKHLDTNLLPVMQQRADERGTERVNALLGALLECGEHNRKLEGTIRMEHQEFIEQLADKEHASWARWMDYLFSKCSFASDGAAMIPSELAARWNRQMCTSYEDLTEQEKQSDRDEVAHILPIIEAYFPGLSLTE
jgi:hypothetical protein